MSATGSQLQSAAGMSQKLRGLHTLALARETPVKNWWLGSASTVYKYWDSAQWRTLGDLANNQTWTGVNTFGGVRVAIVAKSANYTATVNDFAIVFTAAATLSLPSVTPDLLGQTYHVYNEGAGVVTIDPYGAETLKGELTQTLNPGDDLIIRAYASGKWC